MSKDKLLAAGLLFGVLLVFIVGLNFSGRWKPREPYEIDEEEGVLRVRGSRQVIIYYLAVATAFLFVNFLTLVLGIVAFWPLGKYQWSGIAILGIIPLVGYVVFLYFMLRGKWDAFNYVFERSRNRFLHGDTVVSEVSNIRNLQVQRKENRETSKASYVLSVILKEGEPHSICELEEPATPLFKLSERIANYLGTEINQGQGLILYSDSTTGLALLTKVLLAILAIVGVILLITPER